MPQAMMTTIVPWMTWFWVGHSTFFSSAQDSETKRLKPLPGTRRDPVWVFCGCADGRTACWRARARWVTLFSCGSSCCGAALRSTPLAPALPRVPGH